MTQLVEGAKRGRPAEGRERKVSIQVMVLPKIRDYLSQAAEIQNKTLSGYVNEVLEHFYKGR